MDLIDRYKNFTEILSKLDDCTNDELEIIMKFIEDTLNDRKK